MVRVPLPQESPRPVGQGGFVAPRSAVPLGPAGRQLEELGQATERAGLGVARQATLLQQQRDVAAAKEAQALAEEFVVEADQGYRSRIGKAATGKAREEAFKGLQDQIQKIGDGLDEVPRELFQQVMRRRMTDVDARWGGHEIEQTRVYEDAASQAVIEAKEKSARDEGPTGEDGLGAPTMLGPLKVEIQGWADSRGYGPEQTAHEVLRRTTRVHSSIIGNLLLNGRSTQARAYFDRHRAEITADEVDRLKSQVQIGSVQEEGAQLAFQIADEVDGDQPQATGPSGDELFPEQPEGADALFPPQPSGAGSFSEPAPPEFDPFAPDRLAVEGLARIQAMQEAGQVTGDVANAARGQITRMAKERKAAEILATNEVSRAAEQWMVDNPLASVEQMPPALYQQVRERGLLTDLNRFSGSEGRFATDREVFSQLFLERGGGWFALERDAFVNILRRKLSPRHLERAVDMYARANTVTGFKPTAVLSLDDRIKESARRIGFISRGRDSDLRSEKFFNYQEEIHDRVSHFEGRAGRKAVDNELKALIAEVEQDFVYLDNELLDTRVHISQLTSEQEARDERPGDPFVYVTRGQLAEAWQQINPETDLPREIADVDLLYRREILTPIRSMMVTRLRARGLPVTDASVAALWLSAGRPTTVEEVLR